MLARLVLLVLTLCCIDINTSVYGQYASTFPDPIPLIHKSPYFNAWIGADGNATTPENRWPVFFSGPFLRWMIAARVDGTGYIFQGIHVNYTNAKTVRTNITPTRTIFTVEAGPMRAELTFLTPIELNDWTLHSLPFAYVAVNLSSIDGGQHNVQLYSDVTGQFVSSNPESVIIWNTTLTPTSIYHQAQQRSMQSMTENDDMSEDGTQYLAYTTTPGVAMTWQTGGSEVSRVSFAATGKLANTSDTTYRVIGGDWPVLALALDLGNISQTSKPLVFALGLVRDPVAQYQTADGLQNRSQLWWTRWGNISAAIDNFLAGFSSAVSRAVVFDNKVAVDSSTVAAKFGLSFSVETKLTDLVILNLRQTIGSLELTTSRLSNGRLGGMDDLRIFMKDMGSSKRVNAVETVYASFPAFLYLNASLAGALLEPLLEFQASQTLYNKGYAAPDLGGSWPKVFGNNTDQLSLGVENCGSMLIMVLAHAQKSGEGRLIVKYYDLLRKWADFLVNNSLQPTGYMTADGILGETSNLVIKGITGIYAMGKVNQVLEATGRDPNRTSYYLSTARNYSRRWESTAKAADHVTSTYGNDSSWGLLYNLYAPRLIQADIFSDRVYEIQATFYASQSTKAQGFGLPFDNSQPYVAKSHWSLLTAGSIFNFTVNSGRDYLINTVHGRAFANPGWQPNPSTYSVVNGLPTMGAASPALGAAYAFLALNLPDVAITLSSSNGKNKMAPILGGVLGGIVVLIVVLSITFIWVRRCRRQDEPLFFSGYYNRKRASVITPFTERRHSPVVKELPGNSSSMGSAMERSKEMSSAPSSSNRTLPAPSSSDQPAEVSGTGNNLGITGSGGGALLEAKATPTPDESLRREVEQLRVENEALRMQQMQPVLVDGDDPPPVYANQVNS